MSDGPVAVGDARATTAGGTGEAAGAWAAAAPPPFRRDLGAGPGPAVEPNGPLLRGSLRPPREAGVVPLEDLSLPARPSPQLLLLLLLLLHRELVSAPAAQAGATGMPAAPAAAGADAVLAVEPVPHS